MAGVLGCNCRPPDGGRRCRDGRECAGKCLYDSDAKPGPGEDPDRMIGRCAEFETTFGCVSYIPDGAMDEPVPRGLRRVPRICTD